MSESSQAEGNYFEFIRNNHMEPVLVDFHQDINEILFEMDHLDGILLPGGETMFEMDSFRYQNKDYFRIKKGVESKYLERV